jgi:hypothetical protein
LAVHEEIAGDEAAELADRASFDGSAGGERLRRMQTARSRELRQTLELLMKMQKGDDNRQAAGSGGKVKDSDNVVTETRAPTVAAPGDGQREAGSAAKPRLSKRRRGRYRSAAALEMVMAERLAEQAFEMCFTDPPAELAALKSSPKLAELKVLPGRAPVRDHGATKNSDTTKLGLKKSQIEGDCPNVKPKLRGFFIDERHTSRRPGFAGVGR